MYLYTIIICLFVCLFYTLEKVLNRSDAIEDIAGKASVLEQNTETFKSKSYVSNLYIKRDLPIREIARQMNVSHSTVIECLRRLGIHDKGSKKRIIIQGQIPFGFDYKNGKLVKNKEEQEVIRIIKQLRSSGLSLRGIARELNKRLVPTKHKGIWQATTVSKILERVGS